MKTSSGGKHIGLCVGLWGIALTVLLSAGARAQEATRFEAEIQAFESTDRASPPPVDPILFVGTSSIRMWTDLAPAFPDYPVLNRGFGGSYLSDLLYYFDRVVAVYQPAFILVYEGDNDLGDGKSVDQVYSEYVTFLAKVKQQLPAADVAFISVIPSPSAVAVLEPTRQLNARLQALAAADPVLQFIDVCTPMLDATGQPRAELFGSDLLHMNAAGYTLWKTVIGPVLDAWAASKGQSFLFDFGAADTPTGHGPSPDDPVNYWNNVTETIGGSPTGLLRGVVNTRNKPTDIVLQMLSPFNGSGPSRSGTVMSVRFPPNATKDSLYSTEASSSTHESPEMFASFQLMGLNRERVYDFTFCASVGPVLDDRGGRSGILEANYTATGANSASVAYDPANNWYDRTATVIGIVPDALGQITISLVPTARHNRYGIHLGVLQVDEVPPPKAIVFVAEPADQTVMVYRPATFQAAVDGAPPYTIQWLRNRRPIDGATDFTYTIPRVTRELQGAVYSVCVSNALDRAISRGAILTVLPDFYGPKAWGTETPDALTLRLSFDELLDPNSVTAVTNYWINAGSVPVVSAVLEADGRTVTLTLGARLTSAFSVRISGVRDLAGNEVNAGTTVIGTLEPQPQENSPQRHGERSSKCEV